MTFEEEFPSLWGLWQVKASFVDDQGDKVGEKQPLTGEFILSDLQQHCLDKQRVREVIEKMRLLTDFKKVENELVLGSYLAIRIDGLEPADWLKKELGL